MLYVMSVYKNCQWQALSVRSICSALADGASMGMPYALAQKHYAALPARTDSKTAEMGARTDWGPGEVA